MATTELVVGATYMLQTSLADWASASEAVFLGHCRARGTKRKSGTDGPFSLFHRGGGKLVPITRGYGNLRRGDAVVERVESDRQTALFAVHEFEHDWAPYQMTTKLAMERATPKPEADALAVADREARERAAIEATLLADRVCEALPHLAEHVSVGGNRVRLHVEQMTLDDFVTWMRVTGQTMVSFHDPFLYEVSKC